MTGVCLFRHWSRFHVKEDSKMMRPALIAVVCIQLIVMLFFANRKKRPEKEQHIYNMLLLCLLAVGAALCLWRLIADFTPSPKESITITALAEKSEGSKAANLYLTGVYVDSENTGIHIEDAGDWAWKESWFTWDQSSTAENHSAVLNIPMGKARYLEFFTNKSKGLVQVSCGGQVQIIDCCSEEDGRISVLLPDSDPMAMRPVKIRQGMVFAVLDALVNGLLFVLLISRPAKPPRVRKRNAALVLFRYIMCCFVIIHHFKSYGKSTAANAGFLCVDVFFVISGFFLMQHFQSHPHDKAPGPDALGYLGSRLKAIVPHHLFSWICMAVIAPALGLITVSDLLEKGWGELLLLKGVALGNNITVNGVSWYLGCLLILSYLIYYLLCRDRSLYLHFLAPMAFFLVMAYLYCVQGKLNVWVQTDLIPTMGFWRGTAEMSLGVIAYTLYEGISRRLRITRGVRITATVAETAGWLLVLYQMWTGNNYRDFLVPILAAFLIISLFSCDSYLTRFLNNDVSAFLGKISFPMYLNQFILMRPVVKLMPGLPFRSMTILLLAGLTVLSLFTGRLVDRLTEKIGRSLSAVMSGEE